jgi:hypothetical protein
MSLTIDLYGCPTDGAKFYGFHMNGTQHAAFCNAYAALSWRRGLRELTTSTSRMATAFA